MSPPLLELRDVARTYPGPVPVEALRATSLVVRRGEYVAVVGPSGSGKSTLMALLGLLDVPTAGVYLVRGQDSVRLPAARRCALRAHTFGFVSQRFHLLARRTVAQNVGLGAVYAGLRGGRDLAREVGAALAAVRLEHRRDARAATLSGGEQQRVAIARALVGRPEVLLCDEPTGSLDSVTGTRILELLSDLHAGGVTLVVITHDPTVAACATRLIHIEDGVVAEGPARLADSR